MEVTLRREGFRVLTAPDGTAALAKAHENRPDLILLDWEMPRLSGVDACRALRQDPSPELRQIPVVLVTAFAHADDLRVAFEAGVTDYLTKPVSPQQVRARATTWLRRKSFMANG